MVIKLLGETEENKKVREPVTVKTKLECKTCGTTNPTTSKFCSECGTSLEIVGG
jgi:rRNA maturation endonuclease Nob1